MQALAPQRPTECTISHLKIYLEIDNRLSPMKREIHSLEDRITKITNTI